MAKKVTKDDEMEFFRYLPDDVQQLTTALLYRLQETDAGLRLTPKERLLVIKSLYWNICMSCGCMTGVSGKSYHCRACRAKK